MKIKIFFLFNLLLLFSDIYSQVNLVDNKGKILIMESSASKGTGALRDSNGNLKANNFINSFQTSTTSGNAVTLTVSSKQIQEFTGSTTQILTLPVTTTLATGHQFYIVNNSTAPITLNSSGGGLVVSAAAASRVVVTCILSSGTTAASWTADLSTLSGNASNVTGIVAVANGGTGSSTKNFVDLSSAQTVAGAKTFSSDLNVNGATIGLGLGNGIDNIAFGKNVLATNTTGNGNVAIGTNSLTKTSTGSNNIGIGFEPLKLNISGGHNVAIGFRSLYTNTTGDNNVAIGEASLQQNIAGGYNTALGVQSLSANTGGNNTAVGVGTIDQNTTGSNNAVLGAFAGRNSSTGSNILIHQSVLIGADVKPLLSGSINEIVIGYGAIGNGSNTVTLGNLSVTAVKTSGSITAGAVTYPNLHNSTAGQVLTTNDYGVASWATPATTATNVSGIVLGANGGTGVDNTDKTITIGGNLTTTGAFTTNLTATANTALTLPTTGTLATLKDITDANNAFKTPLAITTGNYTITSSDYTVLCNASNGAFLLTLPPATSSKDKIIIIKKIDVTNNPINFSQSIYITDILTATSINYPKTIKIQSNGTNWYIIN